MIEAMACGTPVVAFARLGARGHARRRLRLRGRQHRRGGARRPRRRCELPRKRCRADFEERFTAPRMAARLPGRLRAAGWRVPELDAAPVAPLPTAAEPPSKTRRGDACETPWRAVTSMPKTSVLRHQDSFYILATSTRADDRTRVLKHGETFAVFDRFGDVQPVGLGEQGLYHDGTRFLSRLELRIGGRRPLLLSSTVKEDNDLLAVDLAEPRSRGGGRLAALARGRAARLPHEVPLAAAPATSGCASPTSAASRRRSTCRCRFRRRLRRHLRGARDEARAARPARCRRGRQRDDAGARLSGPRRRRAARRGIDVRSAARRRSLRGRRATDLELARRGRRSRCSSDRRLRGAATSAAAAATHEHALAALTAELGSARLRALPHPTPPATTSTTG